MLAFAIQVQRLYARARREGFSFARGLRIALNYGQYRLLPVQVGRDGDQERYEFFGQGVVELSRLTTGKAAKEVDELKTFLITHGYPEGTVNRFFAPLASHGLDLVDRQENAGVLRPTSIAPVRWSNEGIVATGGFVEHLGHVKAPPTGSCGRERPGLYRPLSPRPRRQPARGAAQARQRQPQGPRPPLGLRGRRRRGVGRRPLS